MDFDEQGYPPRFHPQYEPHLPKRLGAVQFAPKQLFARLEKVLVAGQNAQSAYPDVICHVEGMGIDP
jgi:hypothetical protein